MQRLLHLPSLWIVSILIVFSLVLLLPIFFHPFFITHDGLVHIVRENAYANALIEMQFPPRWAPLLNFGYGSPIFLVFYPFAGYITALFHLLGLSLENSYTLLLIFSFILGPVFWFLWTKELTNKNFAFVSSIFYTVMPYRFLTTLVRGSIGEILAYSLIPLIFYSVDAKNKKLLLGILAYTLILLSHNGVSLMITPIFVFYCLIRRHKLRTWLPILLFGLGISSYFWIPSLIESKYMSFLIFHKDMYKDHFLQLTSLFYSPWGFDDDVNKIGGLSPQVGIPALIVAVLGLYYFIKKRANESILAFWIIVFLIGLFLSTNFSIFLWEKSDFLKKFQFPWRFMMLSSLSTAVLFSSLYKKISIKFLVLLAFCSILYAIPFIKIIPSQTHKDSFYQHYRGSSTFRAEATPIWSPGDPEREIKKNIEIIGGSGEIKNVSKKSIKHTFNSYSHDELTILDNTLYFPGWNVYVDGKKVPVQFQDPHHQGLITFTINKGNHFIEIIFEDTKIRMFSNMLSIGSVIVLLLIIGVKRSKNL
ncbi:MAG: hypothetical protein HZC02_04390 [Candidatus Levybacteria bacterium]|nr:hypothetical protein [Candidatus Levybacteria bacterium]